MTPVVTASVAVTVAALLFRPEEYPVMVLLVPEEPVFEISAIV
jgi:hypothetical protein